MTFQTHFFSKFFWPEAKPTRLFFRWPVCRKKKVGLPGRKAILFNMAYKKRIRKSRRKIARKIRKRWMRKNTALGNIRYHKCKSTAVIPIYASNAGYVMKTISLARFETQSLVANQYGVDSGGRFTQMVRAFE